MRIGIVGSGIAGLCAAYWLNKKGVQVTLFEKLPLLGMDAHRTQISANENGSLEWADVPSRMFNDLQWPNLLSLYKELGISVRPVRPTQSFSERHRPSFLKLSVAHRPWQFLKLAVTAKSRRILSEAKRLQTIGTEAIRSEGLGHVSFEAFLSDHQFSSEFVNEFLLPTLSSTVLTCSYSALRAYPAVLVLSTLKNLADSPSLLRTQNGTQDVVARLTSELSDIRLSTRVTACERIGGDVRVESEGVSEQFDHVVFATQANHVPSLLVDMTEQESTALRSVRYETVSVVVHSDPQLMPPDRRSWSTFNMIHASDRESAMCSVWLNEFHDEWNLEQAYFQTINPVATPREETIVSRAKLQRPVVDSLSQQNWERIAELNAQPDRRVWFTGSYAHPGVPLLETGVQASRLVVENLLRRDANVRRSHG